MPGGRGPGPSVKKPSTYEAVKAKGNSKEKSVRIANAQAKAEKGKKKR